MKDVELMLGDCLVRMQEIEAGSVDLVLADLPYGTTACVWDQIIPLEPLWAEYRRVLKPRGAVVLTASQPFTSELVMSNREWFRYCRVWKKTKALGFQNAKHRPMTNHEDIVVFSPASAANNCGSSMTYNPQGLRPYGLTVNGTKDSKTDDSGHRMARPSHQELRVQEYTGYPTSVIEIANDAATVHPTQKPLPLFEYLILTYSNPGDLILDNVMGSGTTGVACLNTDRRFIGIERDPAIFQTAQARITDATLRQVRPHAPKLILRDDAPRPLFDRMEVAQ